jgi:hypothetical protein
MRRNENSKRKIPIEIVDEKEALLQMLSLVLHDRKNDTVLLYCMNSMVHCMVHILIKVPCR